MVKLNQTILLLPLITFLGMVKLGAPCLVRPPYRNLDATSPAGQCTVQSPETIYLRFYGIYLPLRVLVTV